MLAQLAFFGCLAAQAAAQAGQATTAEPTAAPGTDVATTTARPTFAAAGTCRPGVCDEAEMLYYVGGTSKESCEDLCEASRDTEPVPDGLTMKIYQFHQNGQFHPVNGGPKKIDVARNVKTINYPGTRRSFNGWPGNVRDHFYARWEGKIKVATAGSYHFGTTSDDGSRLWFDGREIVNNAGWHGMRHRGSSRIQLEAGKEYPFWAEMFEGGGGAGMQLRYHGPDSNNRWVIMPESAFAGDIKEMAIRSRQNGRFKNWDDYRKPYEKREPTIERKVKNIDWPGQARGTRGALPGTNIRDQFYVRYEGFIDIKAAGRYTFYTTSDDGSRLYINEKHIVDNPGWHGMRRKEGSTDLPAGKQEIVFEWFEGGGGAGVNWEYKGPDTNNHKVVVPNAVLSVTREGSNMKQLKGDWKKTKTWCKAYSHQGEDCFLWSSCEGVGSATGNSVSEVEWMPMEDKAKLATCILDPLNMTSLVWV